MDTEAAEADPKAATTASNRAHTASKRRQFVVMVVVGMRECISVFPAEHTRLSYDSPVVKPPYYKGNFRYV